MSIDTPSRSEFSASAASSADAVLRAAFEILVTEGLEHVTPTRLHAMTHVARTTIYRHWPTTDAILASLLDRATQDSTPIATTGVLLDDLTAAIAEVTHRLSNGPVRQLVAAMLTADGKQTSTNQLLPTYLQALGRPVIQVLTQAVLDGHLRGPVDLLVARLLGPLTYQSILLGDVLTNVDPQVMAEQFLHHNL